MATKRATCALSAIGEFSLSVKATTPPRTPNIRLTFRHPISLRFALKRFSFLANKMKVDLHGRVIAPPRVFN